MGGVGLNILSELSFRELLLYDFEAPDIDFRIGEVPDSIDGRKHLSKSCSYTINDNELLFVVNGVARYYADQGQKIVISPFDPVTDMRRIRLYVLATVMAAVLLHRKALQLHASAIDYKGGLILITGDIHAGKSTTLTGLYSKGYTVFSDDVFVLQQSGLPVTGRASYPMIKLWDDTLNKMNDPRFENRSFRIQQHMDKYGFFFHDRFDRNAHPVRNVFVLKVKDIPELTFRTLNGKEAFEALIGQIYRPALIQGNDLRFLCRFERCSLCWGVR